MFGNHFNKFKSCLGESLMLNGQQLRKDPEDEHHLLQDVKDFAEAVTETIENCFPEDQLMQYCVVIDPSLFLSSDEDLVAYGNEAITYLAEEIVDQEKLEEEWMRFKFIVSSNKP